jgi:hypothetical protein
MPCTGKRRSLVIRSLVSKSNIGWLQYCFLYEVILIESFRLLWHRAEVDAVRSAYNDTIPVDIRIV